LKSLNDKEKKQCIEIRVMLFQHLKVDNFWDNLFFSLAAKKKVRGGEKE
jgi:hypothetical protein